MQNHLNDKALSIDICVSPFLYPVYQKENCIVVVIDILRATSAICTAFEYGVDRMIPVASVEEAMQYKSKGYLVGAERNGIQLEGVDFGNSPFSYMNENIKGKTIVLSTTNGTQAIEAARKADKVVIGAYTNISALCKYIASEHKNVLMLCSGWKNKLNLEDTLFAGTMVNRLTAMRNYKVGDAAQAIAHLSWQAEQNPFRFIRKSSHAERLAALGLKHDIKYCLSLDKTAIIPTLKGDFLITN